MKENKIWKLLCNYKHIIICCVIYSLITIFTYLITGRFVFVFFIWNLFLAMLPLVFAEFFKMFKKNKVISIIFLLLWLFFLPNAAYVVTDFIHITKNSMYKNAGLYNIDLWLSLFNIFLVGFLSLLGGFKSLDIVMEDLFDNKNILKTVGVTLVSFICGYAIYIGRFLRFNSWNILNPINLILKLLENINVFTIQYTLMTGIFILFSYYIYRSFLGFFISKK